LGSVERKDRECLPGWVYPEEIEEIIQRSES